MPKSGSTVVLVGRPNVGKSTLFNRITGSRRAIVTAIPGTTRDVLEKQAEWCGVGFRLIDTGGMFGASADPLQELVVAHGHRALASADQVVFVVDGRDGLVSADREIAAHLRSMSRSVILAINKIDARAGRDSGSEFSQLGFHPVVEISAEHGQGVGDLLDEVIGRLKPASKPVPASVSRPKGRLTASAEVTPTRRSFTRKQKAGPTPDAPAGVGRAPEILGSGETPIQEISTEKISIDAPSKRRSGRAGRELEDDGPVVEVAIVGRPNVGKSSLVNRLLREERVLVSDVPGTTRDAVDTLMHWHRRAFRIVDTAGIRRAGRVARAGHVEAISVLIARKAITDARVVVLVVDATEGVTDQDAAIAGEAERAGRGIIIAANKWDLVKNGSPTFARTFDEDVRRQLKFLEYAPVLHLSARTGERIGRLLSTIDQVAEARKRRVPTAALNKFVDAVSAVHPPSSPDRRQVRILYATQTGVEPPTFVFFTNVAARFHFSYERFLMNRLRDSFGFIGSPIRIQVRRRAQR